MLRKRSISPYDFSFNPASQAVSLTVSDASLNWAPAGVFTEDYVANGLNQYTDVGTADPVHDSAGNVATDHRGQTYLYTAENVLKEATVSGTNYKYGLYGDNMRSNTNIAGVGAQGYFYYDPVALAGLPQEIAEYDGGDDDLVRRYIRLPGAVDEVILMIDYTLDDCSSSYAACEVWAHHDRLGSTVATSDSAGNEIDTYTYSHFGESGPEGDSGFPFRFTGQKIDAETGLYYYKARHYDPEVGRFMQTDPIGYAGGMNLYAYVGNDPGNGVDPLGLVETIVVVGTRKCLVGSLCFDTIMEQLSQPTLARNAFGPSGGGGGNGRGDRGDRGGEAKENKEYQACLDALSQLRNNSYYGDTDKVLGILLYRNIFGAVNYGHAEVIAYQANPAQSTFQDDIYITAPNIQNCEGTQNLQELQDCGRRRSAPFYTVPGAIYSYGNSPEPLRGFGQTPFALLVSGLANLPNQAAWANALGISEDKLLDDSCEALK